MVQMGDTKNGIVQETSSVYLCEPVQNGWSSGSDQTQASSALDENSATSWDEVTRASISGMKIKGSAPPRR